MAYWKLFTLAYKVQRGWKRIPPDRRKKMVEGAGKRARKHGPVIAKRIGTALQQARKGR